MIAVRKTGLTVAVALACQLACAQTPGSQEISVSIEAQRMDRALNALAQQSGLQVLFRAGKSVEGIEAPRVAGKFSAREVLEKLLQGTALDYEFINERTVSVRVRDSVGAVDSGTEDRLRLARADAPAANLDSRGAAPAGAPTAAADPELDEVLVTSQRKFRPETSNAASRFELPLIETPQALTVLSSEFLGIARLNSTADLVAYAPGVELQGIGDGTEPNLVARGFTVNRERGFRINGLSADSEIDLDYYAMDRVEIVRGPASSLYGEADYGATFNRVLKSPTGVFAANMGVEVGSHAFRRLQADVQGPLGSGEVVSARATAAVQDSSTFIRGTEDDRVLFSPSLRIDLGNTDVLIQAYHEKIEGAGSDGFPLLFDGTGYSLPRLPRSNNYGADINRIDSKNQFVFARVGHHFSDSLDFSFKAGYSRVKMQNVSSYLFFAGPDANSTLYSFPEFKNKQDLSLDAAVEKKFEIGQREQRFMLTADWRRNSLLLHPAYTFALGTLNLFEGGPLTGYAPTTPPLPGVNESEFIRNKNYFSGVTALAHFKATERLSLLLAMRYSEIETSIRRFAPTTYHSDLTIKGLKDHAWVPRAALVYQLTQGHNAYLSYSEGIIFNQGFLRADGSPVNPETGIQYEVGFKGELVDRRVMYSAALFRIERTDVAAGTFVPGQPTIYHNVGEEIHQGVEFELVGEPVPGLNLVANYSYLDVDVRESGNSAEVGNQPPAAPAHSYSLFATYELLHGPLRSLAFGGGVVARSEREVDTVGTFQLPKYTRVDLRASYDVSDKVLLEFNLQNAFNKRINVSNYGAADFGIAYVNPRMAFGRISYRW